MARIKFAHLNFFDILGEQILFLTNFLYKMATKAQKKVVIYSTPTCHYCGLAKEYFDENKIKYEAYDVASNIEKRREMMEKSGQLGVPVITVNDKVVVGFNQPLLADLLEIK